jgi:hypothetical protein
MFFLLFLVLFFSLNGHYPSYHAKFWGSKARQVLSQCSLAFSGNGSKLENKYMNKLREKIKPKQDKLIESEILTPDDVEYMQKKGFIEVDDNDNISLTTKGIQSCSKNVCESVLKISRLLENRKTTLPKKIMRRVSSYAVISVAT